MQCSVSGLVFGLARATLMLALAGSTAAQQQEPAAAHKAGAKVECGEPGRPNPVSKPEADMLHRELTQTMRTWSYWGSGPHLWNPHRGKRVLDVGMGQGPMGVLAPEAGVKGYTGKRGKLSLQRDWEAGVIHYRFTLT